MDFISWLFTHVNLLEFMLLAFQKRQWWGGGDNEGDVPVPPMDDLVAQMQEDRTASGVPVRERLLFL